jgi:hypothetical protein
LRDVCFDVVSCLAGGLVRRVVRRPNTAGKPVRYTSLARSPLGIIDHFRRRVIFAAEISPWKVIRRDSIDDFDPVLAGHGSHTKGGTAMSLCMRTICLVVAVSSAAAAVASDAYYDVPLRELKLVDGSLPVTTKPPGWRQYELMRAMQPYATIDGQGEAYLAGQGVPNDLWFSPAGSPWRDAARILIRAPQGKDVTGRLVVPNGDRTGMVALCFTVPSAAAKARAKTPFCQAKIAHYENLLNRDIPGGAWFRHQVRLGRAELHQQSDQQPPPRNRWDSGRSNELTRTYDLLTGGRAMSENLQLDRELPRARPNEEPVKIDSLTGITTNEINWKPLLKGAHPKLDVLACYVPADQHVVFFPSFAAAMAIADETKQHDTPVLRLAQPRSENARVVERYQTQLGLSMSSIARLLGPKFVRSAALTGSDPFFITGTDVAVLFESPQPTALETLLVGRVALAATGTKEAKPVSGQVAGVKYRGFRSPDRAMSSYIARLDGVVVVTNSLYQLRRLAETHGGRSKSIAVLPEYLFFRTRYPLGAAEETALIFLSDATIRRWCGPRWRIADSRRTRARAVLAELQASQLDALVKKTVKAGPIHTDLPLLDEGELMLTPSGVRSATLGVLDFMTPIGESSLDEVTQAEADAYRAWREGYQRNWSWGFDPIALRISLAKQKLAADMTVMPLILGTQYREFTEISLGGKFDPTAGDPHDALAQFILALNHDSFMFKRGENIVLMTGQAVSLGWIGRWATVYADDDPFWKDLEKVQPDKIHEFMEKNVGRIPVAVRIDTANPLKLAAFLSGARAFIEQTAPGLTQWESRKYKDQAYVRITPVKGSETVPRDMENLAIYYTPLGGALTVTLSEKMLERSIDRWLIHAKVPAEAKPAPVAKSWLGSNVALRVDRKILEVANALSRDQYQRTMQSHCWANLAILNEWKRLYPDRDPVKVHAQVWGVELVCPGGGKYVWNDKYRTMASTVYGHPGEPKVGPPAPPMLSSFAAGSFGLTFENQGLRARAELSRGASVKTVGGAEENRAPTGRVSRSGSGLSIPPEERVRL